MRLDHVSGRSGWSSCLPFCSRGLGWARDTQCCGGLRWKVEWALGQAMSVVIRVSAPVDFSSSLADRQEGINRRGVNEKDGASSQRPGLPFDASCQALRTLAAWRPFGPLVTSNSTLSPSAKLLKPWAWTALKCTNTSSPFSCEMKPNPFASLNHFTLP